MKGNNLRNFYLAFLFLIISSFFGFGALFIFVLLKYNVILSIFFSYMLVGSLLVILVDYENHYKNRFNEIGKKK